jgi:uncharacterized protein GlcG (DUF336 family)
MRKKVRLRFLELEQREVPAAVATLVAGTLTVTADALGGRLDIFQDGSDIVVRSRGDEVGRFGLASVTALTVVGGPGADIVRVDNALTLPTALIGSSDRDKLSAGGGSATFDGGATQDLLVGGTAGNTFLPSPGGDKIYKALPGDTVTLGPGGEVLVEANIPLPPGSLGLPQETMTAGEVGTILDRAAAASASSDAIIAITDRNGRILGVRVESGVDPAITGDPEKLVFAIDGAVSLARTGAFFASNQAPLTSRTIQFISQSTITQREVDSDPSITDPNSTERGPGFVAPVSINGHFPPGVPFTPQVDLFAIEHTNRDSIYAPGPDGIIGTADDVLLPERFNDDPAFVPPGQELFAPDSYGVESGVSARTGNGVPIAESRGIATLPGGIPLYKNGQVVGGIGVFFPGKTGFATEENSSLSATYDPTKPDRTLEAEWIAFAAAGGARAAIGVPLDPRLFVGDLGGVALPAGYGLPLGRIDLVGIQLDVFGPGGLYNGSNEIVAEGAAVGRGSPSDGTNQVVSNNGTPSPADDVFLRDGLPVPEGWLVTPHDGVGITAAEVTQIITQGLAQANDTRAAIRLPLGSRAKFVFAVADRNGNIVGLYRMPDATVFSIDVAVAKARNVNYYADSAKLQAIDQLTGVPAGTAFTNRTFRYLANPRYPTGIDGAPPGPFSQLNDGGVDPNTGLEVGPPLPASAYQSVLGHDAFNPETNFRDPTNKNNQDGIVFFPGSAPVYRGNDLIGGLGVSGDGVDEDDVNTDAGQTGFGVPAIHLRADQVVFQGVRLPYQKFDRNPEG